MDQHQWPPPQPGWVLHGAKDSSLDSLGWRLRLFREVDQKKYPNYVKDFAGDTVIQLNIISSAWKKRVYSSVKDILACIRNCSWDWQLRTIVSSSDFWPTLLPVDHSSSPGKKFRIAPMSCWAWEMQGCNSHQLDLTDKGWIMGTSSDRTVPLVFFPLTLGALG